MGEKRHFFFDVVARQEISRFGTFKKMGANCDSSGAAAARRRRMDSQCVSNQRWQRGR